jgi:HEAT repeat protein
VVAQSNRAEQAENPGTAPAQNVSTGAATAQSKATAQNKATAPAVEWKSGRLSVHAEKASLALVLQKVADVTGTDVQGLEKAQGQITAQFSDVTLSEGLQKLLPDYDYAFSEGDAAAPGGAHARLIILESMATRNKRAVVARTDEPATGSAPPGSEDTQTTEEEQARKLEDIQRAAENQEIETLVSHIQDSDPVVQSAALDALVPIDQSAAADALLAATKSDRVPVVLGALTLLNQTDTTDEPTILTALNDALNNKSTAVRTYAVQALAGHGKAAVDALERAMKDSDPSVRMAVVQGAGQNRWGIPLLREALSDKDESVRKTAALLLQHAPPPDSSAGERESEGDPNPPQ